MLGIEKKQIIKNLNYIINNYEGLCVFCNELSNDVNIVIDTISKIIKYVFIKEKISLYSDSLFSLLFELKQIDDLDQKYREKINKNRLFVVKSKKNNYDSFSIPLHPDIIISDIKKLRLPRREDIENICKENLKLAKIEEEKKMQRYNNYKKQKGFDEVGLEYTRPELITIDKSFEYYGTNLTGDPNQDYNLLYNDDRYGMKNKTQNPLNNSYNYNMATIKQNTDISIRVLGKLNEIKNGRHRIIYILYNGKPATIPSKVTRRIEDKEINIVLLNLRNKYNFIILKNSLLNDEPNILLVSNNVLYEITNKTELLEFYNNILNKNTNDHFNHIQFKLINNNNKGKVIDKYKMLIFKRYLDVGAKLLTSNFTDILEYFNGEANSLFYEAYHIMQYEYQMSLIYDYDFGKMYENMANNVQNNMPVFNSVQKPISK